MHNRTNIILLLGQKILYKVGPFIGVVMIDMTNVHLIGVGLGPGDSVQAQLPISRFWYIPDQNLHEFTSYPTHFTHFYSHFILVPTRYLHKGRSISLVHEYLSKSSVLIRACWRIGVSDQTFD